jgi:hypothetical protein
MIIFRRDRSRWNCKERQTGFTDSSRLELQRFYRRKLVQKGLGKARAAVARKLGIRLWIMLRDQIDYEEFCRRGQKQSGAACAGMPETAFGA